MLINLRNALMTGKKRVTFIEWLASDGTGYVDLQYAPTDPETRMLITASTSTDASNYAPLVCAGMNTAMNDVSKTSFGFASINNDRQIYLKSARQHWWNLTANAGNWDDGNFHSIDIGQSGATSSTCSVDGLSISMQRISNSTSGSMPTDTQTVFASKYNGAYYMINSKFKVSRIAYEVNGVIVHDFRAAMLGHDFGFYDEITGDFMAGVGTFVAGPEIHAVEYIESHGTEYIDTGYIPTMATKWVADMQWTSTAWSQITGIRNGVGSQRSRFAVGRDASGFGNAWVFATGNVANWTGTFDTNRHTFAIDMPNGTASIDATNYSTGATALSTTGTVIFMARCNTSGVETFVTGRLFGSQFFDNGILSRSYKPIRVGTDATSWEGAMMDVLTRRIYRNQGTGAFTYGNDLKYPIPAS